MQGDFERVTFDPKDAFANVLMQQGRLLLPADFNELGAILQHALQQYIVDSQGSDWQVGDGFAVTVASDATLKFTVKKGCYYVDGLRCYNADEFEYGSPQPFWSKPDGLDDLSGDNAIVYLDCWERHVSWLQNGRLRDVALGGLDTATRVQIAWQVRAESEVLARELDEKRKALQAQLAAGGDKPTLTKRITELEDLRKLFDGTMTLAQADKILDEVDDLDRVARPRMAADAKFDAPNPDPCAIAPDAEYRGRENQLYRVEIHGPGTAKDATFKWSRENGSVAFRVLDVVVADKETHVTVESLGRDRRNGVCENDWVELIDDDLELSWTPTPLMQVSKVDVQRRTITLKGKATKPPDPSRHAILRRWDHSADDESKGALAVVEAKNDTSWIELERGIKIRFTIGGYYRKGDYWLIPARVVTGDIEWPADGAGESVAIEPRGVIHHRAVLALVTKVSGKWQEKP